VVGPVAEIRRSLSTHDMPWRQVLSYVSFHSRPLATCCGRTSSPSCVAAAAVIRSEPLGKSYSSC